MTYYSPKKLAPLTAVVNIDGVDYPLTDPSAWKQDPSGQGLGIGTPEQGLYIYREDISGRISPAFPERCRAYYFQVNNTDGTFRLPENGYYGTCDYLLRDLRTTDVNLYANYPSSCADNWVETSPPPIKQIPSFPPLPDKIDGQLYSLALGQSGPWGDITLHPGGDSALVVQTSPSNILLVKAPFTTLSHCPTMSSIPTTLGVPTRPSMPTCWETDGWASMLSGLGWHPLSTAPRCLPSNLPPTRSQERHPDCIIKGTFINLKTLARR